MDPTIHIHSSVLSNFTAFLVTVSDIPNPEIDKNRLISFRALIALQNPINRAPKIKLLSKQVAKNGDKKQTKIQKHVL